MKKLRIAKTFNIDNFNQIPKNIQKIISSADNMEFMEKFKLLMGRKNGKVVWKAKVLKLMDDYIVNEIECIVDGKKIKWDRF